MTSKDKPTKPYQRSCSGCHIHKPRSGYEQSYLSKPVSVKTFTEMFCDECLRNQKNDIRRSTTSYAIEDNFIVKKLQPSDWSEPFEMFPNTLMEDVMNGRPIRQS